MESGRELSRAIANRFWPSQEAVGGALVVVGVFAEVAAGIFIARSAKRAELEANEAISEARDRSLNIEDENIRLRIELAQAISESRSKQANLDIEQRKTAEAQEKAAKAQKELAENLSSLARRSGDRILDFKKFADGIKDAPKLSVEIWYAPNDEETNGGAVELDRDSSPCVGNWDVKDPPVRPTLVSG